MENKENKEGEKVIEFIEDAEAIETENIRHIDDIRPKKIKTVSVESKEKQEVEKDQQDIDISVRNVRAYMLENVFCCEEDGKSKKVREIKQDFVIDSLKDEKDEKDEKNMDTIDEVDYQLWQNDFCNVMDVLFTLDEIKEAYVRIKVKNFINRMYDKWIKFLYRLRLKKATWDRLEDALKYENNKILSTQKEYDLILKKMAITLSIFNDDNVEKIQNVIKNRTCEGILSQRPHLDIDLLKKDVACNKSIDEETKK